MEIALIILKTAREILNLPGRASEWALAAITFNVGWILLLPPTTLSAKGYSLLEATFSEQTWGYLCLLLGASRIVILGLNGSLRQSPGLRSVCSVAACFFWTNISLSLLASHPLNTTGSLGIGVYPVLLILDIVNMFRAIDDGGFFRGKR